MKKCIAAVLAVLLCLSIAVPALAAELKCTVTADIIAAAPGDTVTVAVRIGDNPGFTNCAVALDYDRTNLTLKSIETKNGQQPYLCGTHVSVNTQWKDGESTYGYVVCASDTPVKENGILFTATFQVAEGFSGTAEVTPKVSYIRNNEAVFSVFEQIQASVIPGEVSTVLVGDVNGDGIVEYDDVVLAYRAYLKEVTLPQEQMVTVDRNGNGIVEEAEYKAVYQAYIGG